ncbi:MAG: hypothetical protein ACE5SW_08800, partial [Nitrososphaeraceae archaeon]
TTTSSSDSNENLGSTETITSFPPSAIETSESGNITTTSSSDSNENLGSTETITSFPPSAIETSESGNITTTSSSDSNDNIDTKDNKMVSEENLDSLSKMDIESTPNYLNLMK